MCKEEVDYILKEIKWDRKPEMFNINEYYEFIKRYPNLFKRS